jgi:excisionase family DNA binding protein
MLKMSTPVTASAATSKTRSFEEAISAPDFSSEDYCGTSYAAKLLGLSVATVQSMVEKGEIEAWKTLGGHRRISLQSISTYLAKHNQPSSRVSAAAKTRLKVLIVEDDEAARELYRLLFDEWGLPVDCTWMPSALEALMDIASMRPDLLITDLSMPGVDGIEMLKVLQRNVQLSGMHILVVSGMPPESIEARGGLPHYARLLPKPINFDWLQGYMTAMVSITLRDQDQTASRRNGRKSAAGSELPAPQAPVASDAGI